MSQTNLLPSERTSGAPRPKREREPAPTIDLFAWLYLYREKFGWIILGLVVMPALAFLYLSVARKMYTAQCVVQVESEERLLSGKHDVSPEDEFKTIEALRTVEGALSSRSLLLRVVKANTLDKVHPDFSAKPGQPALTDAELADIMQRRIDVSLRRGTRLIDITADDPNPQRAAMLASSLVNEYIKLNFEQKSEAARLANEALYRQRDELKEKLQKTEEALQTYREQFGVVSLEMGSDGKQSSLQNSNSDKLKELNRQLQEVRSDRIKLEGLLPVAKRASKLSVDELLAVEPIAKAQDVIESQKLLAAKEEEFGEIKKRYLELHPKFQQVQSQLADIRKSIERTARKAATGILIAHESALESERKLQQAMNEQERAGVELSRVAIPFNVLLRDAQADRELYDQVSARVREIELTNQIERSNVRIIQMPDVPIDPSKPKKPLILALGVFAGLAIPVFLIFITNVFNMTIRSVDEAERLLGLSSLAAIPQAKGRAAKNPLVLVKSPSSREAEAFRCMRTSLSIDTGNNPPAKTILITSAVPSEGKSYCATNLAIALAQQGHSTLLIDADLRRPGLGNYLPLAKDKAGLSDVLAGRTTLANAAHSTEIERLSLMPAGTKGATPSELLGGPSFAQLVSEARKKYDRVVIDTAPVNAVSDTLLLVDKVEAVVLVVRARKTITRVLRRARHLLILARAPLVGFALNRLPNRLANYYYYDEGNYSSAGVYGT